jgi:hypothetical protein
MAKDSKKIAEEVMAATECAFEKAFPDCSIVKKLNELLEAKKTVSAVSGRGADAGTVDFVDVPDYGTQVKALDIVTDIRGLRRKKVDLKVQGNLNLVADVVAADEELKRDAKGKSKGNPEK